METLRQEVYGAAMQFYNEFIYSRVESERILESMAKANVAFAKYETNLFKLLFFRKLNGLNSFNDIYEWMGDKQATRQLAQKLSLSEEKIKRRLYYAYSIYSRRGYNDCDGRRKYFRRRKRSNT